MTQEELELLEFDRLEVIKQTIQKYGENNFYLSFSGGKDSTILHCLLDKALPENKIPRVFINTGIEYNAIVEFVKEMAQEDDRFIILKPTKPIRETLEKYGYPFKSKEHSLRVEEFNKDSNANYIYKYIHGRTRNGQESKFHCPKMLLYQFEEKGKYNYSNKCCYKLKKEPVNKWAKENKKPIVITGMRKEEGGNRARLGCIITKNGKVAKFHPLIVVTDEWEEWIIKKYGIKLCKLYSEPFNFKRTGCKGCPYSLTLQEQLDTMAIYMPQEKKQCELIWKPVYEEYRKLNYRLKKDKEINLFDFKGE